MSTHTLDYVTAIADRIVEGAMAVFLAQIAATTTPEPTVGLVFYDLKSCLREADAGEKPKRRRAPRKDDGEA